MTVEVSVIIVAGGGWGLGLAAATALRDAGARVGVIDMRQGAWDGPFADADVSDDAAVERAFDALAPVIETLRAMLNTTGRQPAMGGGDSHVGLSAGRSEEHTSELQSLMRIQYAVFCLKKKKYYKT